MTIELTTGVLIGVAVATVLVALLGATGYAVTIGRRQARQIADVAARLTDAADAADGPGTVDTAGIRDRRVRDGLRGVVERFGLTWIQATVDPLTGVLNRQALLSRLEEELRRADRYLRPCSVALIDLDHFKVVNDTFGHAAGDVVLREVAATLQRNVRTTDIIGRYGGEEFMVVLPETDADAAATSAEKLRRMVAARPVRLPDGASVTVTISVGVAGGYGQRLELDPLIRDADGALYSAKALGRDQVYVFRELEETGSVRRSTIGPEARQRAVDVGRVAMNAAATALVDALAHRFGHAGEPSRRISEIAASLARITGLPEGEVARIRTASVLHDLGNLAMPDEILANHGELTDSEWRVVTEHPRVGQIVLEEAGALRDAAVIVLHHHEWFDGRGYPHGLAGDEIPMGARIVAIADAYSAMVEGRPYRAALSHQAALAELRRHAGTQFDPELVRLFGLMYADGAPGPGRRDPLKLHARAN